MTDTLADRLGADAALELHGARLLHEGHSSFQRYEVWDTPTFGRLYRLDGHFMAAEADEFNGHESLIHVAAIAHPAPCRALVLGGGDGGSARELLRHPSIGRVIVAELDAEVVALSRRYLAPIHGGAFDDGRVELRIGNAYDHVMQQAAAGGGEGYDLIVFDLTAADQGPAAALHGEAFFHACKACLRPGGALVVQLGSPFYQSALVARLHHALHRSFAVVRPYVVDIPLYGGAWAMACASDRLDPVRIEPDEVERRLAARRIDALHHYNGDVHRAQFALSNRLRRLFSFPPDTSARVAES